MYLKENEDVYEDAAYKKLSDSTMQLRIGGLEIIVDVLPIANPLTMMNDPNEAGCHPSDRKRANCTLKQFVRVVMTTTKTPSGKVRKVVKHVDVIVAAIAAAPIRAGDVVTYDYGEAYWPQWMETRVVRAAVCRSACDKMDTILAARAMMR
jgi:hypothetical protein